MYFLKKILFTPENRSDKQCVYRNDDHERVDQSSKFHDCFVPGRGHINHVLKMHYIFKKFLL